MSPKTLLKTLGTRHFYAPRSVLGGEYRNQGNIIDSKFAPYPIIIDWNQFKQFLQPRMNDKTVGERIRYAKQFAAVLQTGDASRLLQVSPDKRIHAMKSLASLSRFMGCYDTWLQIRQRYNLRWSTGKEQLDAFTKFFDTSRDLDTMISWVKQAIRVLPPHLGKIIKLNCLLGVRPNECIAAVRLPKP